MLSRLSLLLLFGLAACAGPIETRIVSSGPGIADPEYILQEESPKANLPSRAHGAVLQQLADRGYKVAEAGSLKLDVAFAERDAAIAVLTKMGNDQVTIAPAKQKKALQSCTDHEIRLTVTLTRIADGVELYRGSASEYHCKAKAEDVVPELAKAALADLTKPKGAYSISRQGLE